MVFIESKKTHIINCITLQYLFFFCYGCVFFARQSHTIMLYSSHIIYCHIARVIFIVILHNVYILTVLIQINILLCCTFIVRGEESTSCIFVVVVDFKGKERRCLSRLKWAEKNVKEQNLLSYFKTTS
jgi:hypothetical protein